MSWLRIQIKITTRAAGWGFAAVGIGFFANAWVFNALKGRV